MATNFEDDKASDGVEHLSSPSLINDERQPATPLEKVTAFLKRYGVETTG